jgi:acyl-CoA synthetase (AMP-forming)/AMP-acid ligase II
MPGVGRIGGDRRPASRLRRGGDRGGRAARRRGARRRGADRALKGRIANFKVPKRVFTVDALPRNAMGKVQKNLLRTEHAGLFAEAG